MLQVCEIVVPDEVFTRFTRGHESTFSWCFCLASKWFKSEYGNTISVVNLFTLYPVQQLSRNFIVTLWFVFSTFELILFWQAFLETFSVSLFCICSFCFWYQVLLWCLCNYWRDPDWFGCFFSAVLPFSFGLDGWLLLIMLFELRNVLIDHVVCVGNVIIDLSCMCWEMLSVGRISLLGIAGDLNKCSFQR